MNRILNVLTNLTVSVANHGRFATFWDYKMFHVFFSKNASILFQKRQNLNVLKNFNISVAFHSNFAPFCYFKNLKVFLKKPIYLLKNLDSERFEKSYYFSRILQHFWFFLASLKNSRSFFRKAVHFLEKPGCGRFKKSYFFSCILKQIWCLQ